MKIYYGARGSGKTTKMIMESERTKAVIVAATSSMANYVDCMAKQLSIKIPTPISASCFLDDIRRGHYNKEGYLIDELQMFLDILNVKEATADLSSIADLYTDEPYRVEEIISVPYFDEKYRSD